MTIKKVAIYPGDIVYLQLGPVEGRAIIRQTYGDRVKVQIGEHWTWVFTGELTWKGESLERRCPRTEWGWRRLGRAVAGDSASGGGINGAG